MAMVARLPASSRRRLRLIAVPELFMEARGARRKELPAASVNNSAAKSLLDMKLHQIFSNWENTHRLATNSTARRWTPPDSPSSQATRWSLTNTQWQTAPLSRSHYKPFDGIGRVFSN